MIENITINGVSLPLVTVQIKRGKDKGREFLALDGDSVTLDMLKDAYGEDKILSSIVLPKLRTLFSNYHGEATMEDGTFSEEEFANFATALSARGETIGDIQDRIFECIETLHKTDDPVRMKSIIDTMRSLKEAMENKRRKTAEDKEAEAEGMPTA